ncbi:MAG: DUF1559 domain-containing protein [Capsulimonadaceae bacterium]|nr:DUF1559 domain-containing protein [Capsulimonadaceae bacterium]
MKRLRKSAFTLIELLVVIAIITILAAILFPVFAQAREKARASACLSNLKQIGLAVQQYVQDYDETYPNGTDNYIGRPMGWAGQVYPYVKTAAVYVCPDDAEDGVLCSYGYNSDFASFTSGQGGVTGSLQVGKQLSQLNMPAKTVMLCEISGSVANAAKGYTSIANDNCDNAWQSCSPDARGWYSGSYATGVLRNSNVVFSAASLVSDFNPASGRHQNGSNYLMADFHAKFLPGTLVDGGQPASSPGWCCPVNTGPSTQSSASGTDCTAIAATWSPT